MVVIRWDVFVYIQRVNCSQIRKAQSPHGTGGRVKLMPTMGERLITEIRNGTIKKDTLPDFGKYFHDGYEGLYLYKFKTWLSCVSRELLRRASDDIGRSDSAL